MKRVVLALLVTLVAAAGCRAKVHVGTDGVALAESNAGEPADPRAFAGHVVAYDGARGLRLDGVTLAPPGGAPQGLPPEVKRPEKKDDLLIVPLLDHLKAKPGRTLLALDEATPYAVASELVFTLGQADVRQYEILLRPIGASAASTAGRRSTRVDFVRADDPEQVACIREVLHNVGPALDAATANPDPKATGGGRHAHAPRPLAERERLCIGVMIDDARGAHVRASGDMLAPSCVELGRETTTPAKDGRVDAPAIAACFRAIKERFPEAARRGRIALSAQRAVPWQEVVRAFDAVRESGLEPAFSMRK